MFHSLNLGTAKSRDYVWGNQPNESNSSKDIKDNFVFKKKFC